MDLVRTRTQAFPVLEEPVHAEQLKYKNHQDLSQEDDDKLSYVGKGLWTIYWRGGGGGARRYRGYI